MELDNLDRKILLCLEENGRASLKSIAKKAHSSPEVVRYHVARLQKGGTIKSFMSLVNFSQLGFVGYGVFFQLKGEKVPGAWKEYLKSHPRVYWVADFGGSFDAAFAIAASDPYEFNRIFGEIKERMKSTGGWKVAARVSLVQFPRLYLLPDKESWRREPYFGKALRRKKLTEADFKILKAISLDGRAEIARISEKSGIPSSTVAFRMRKLYDDGILQGVSPQVSCEKFGFQCYQLFISVPDLDAKKKHALFSYAQSNPNVIFFVETLADWNFELILEVQDQRGLQEQLKAIRARFPWIEKSEPAIIFDHNVKYDQFPFASLADANSASSKE